MPLPYSNLTARGSLWLEALTIPPECPLPLVLDTRHFAAILPRACGVSAREQKEEAGTEWPRPRLRQRNPVQGVHLQTKSYVEGAEPPLSDRHRDEPGSSVV